MRALVIDVETTGMVYNHTVDLHLQPSIIEFYAADVTFTKKRYKVNRELNLLIKPPQPLANRPLAGKKSKTIEKITGITDTLLQSAPPFAAVADDIFSMIEAAPLVVAHNISFDKEMLDLEAERLGRSIAWPPLRCTVEQSIAACGQRLTLANLHQHLLGEPFPGAHRAQADVAALLRCMVIMVARGWL